MTSLLTRFCMLLFALCAAAAVNAQPTTSRGRVVINEYMPWPANSCPATTEFIELMNFGPGPVDIGCHILTDGDFSITIPPNIILQPGEYYVIAGQDVIPFPCANIDSSITADLNWNTCGCTSGPIPTTGDGLFTDGGAASEQLVLLDPSLRVIDAVVRDLPTEASSGITTAAIAGCIPQSFDLDTMNVRYEVLGMSAGRGNSFARLVDGDCGWVKDPQQSANATNNRPGDNTDISYAIDIVDANQCGSVYGSVEIHVKHHDYSMIFPMTYTIAFDSDLDGDFDFNDSYSYGADSTPPSISISGLWSGRYRVTVSALNGCYLHTFDFAVLNCYQVLPVQLEYFRSIKKGVSQAFEWKVSDLQDIESMTIQRSDNSYVFEDEASITTDPEQFVYEYVPPGNIARYYRLKIRSRSGRVIYSSVISTGTPTNISLPRIWPSPAKNIAYVNLDTDRPQVASYRVFNSLGALVFSGSWNLQKGKNVMELPVSQLSRGVYQMVIIKNHGPETIRFIKQ